MNVPFKFKKEMTVPLKVEGEGKILKNCLKNRHWLRLPGFTWIG
jgi:hypothetical protein